MLLSQLLQSPFTAELGLGSYILSAILLGTVLYLIRRSDQSDYKSINPRKWFELTDTKATKDFLVYARDYIRSSSKASPNRPWRVIADVGDTLVLPNSYADEVRNIKDLDNDAVSRKDFHTHLSSCASFRPGVDGTGLVKSVVQKQLTQSLGQVSEPLSQECDLVLREVLSDDREWHLVSPLRDAILMIVARLSSRVFLGEELCHNKEWLKITAEHTTTAFKAVEDLRLWPSSLRPLVQWVLPSCRAARAQIARSREIIGPVIDKRREEREHRHEQRKKYDDGIEWFDQNAKGRDYDPALAQLNLSIAAIHTTTDLLMQCILDIARYDDADGKVVEALRDKISSALDEHGWQKTALFKMKLLDSAIKETQRIKPVQMVSMRRLPLRDVTLKDGTFIRRDREVVVSAERMWDESVYPDPQRWDPYRFYNMRTGPVTSSPTSSDQQQQQQQQQHAAQLVSTSADHLGFGHGQHSCPGRFFAANEVKIALAQLLLKYDWKMPDGVKSADADFLEYGWSMVANPFVGVMFRRRGEC